MVVWPRGHYDRSSSGPASVSHAPLVRRRRYSCSGIGASWGREEGGRVVGGDEEERKRRCSQEGGLAASSGATVRKGSTAGGGHEHEPA
jgi:hypothetical protein